MMNKAQKLKTLIELLEEFNLPVSPILQWSIDELKDKLFVNSESLNVNECSANPINTPITTKKKSQVRNRTNKPSLPQDRPCFEWIKERLLEGWSYCDIIKEFNKQHDSDPEFFSTSSGKPLNSAILSLWVKKIDPALRPGISHSINTWKQNNIGFNWVKEQIAACAPAEEVVTEFNNRHRKNPKDYSTFLGGPLSKQTFERWKKEYIGQDQSQPQPEHIIHSQTEQIPQER